MPTDAQRAIDMACTAQSQKLYELVAALESEFAAVRSEATAAAEQRIAALEAAVTSDAEKALLGQMTRALTTAEQWQERATAAEQRIAELEAEAKRSFENLVDLRLRFDAAEKERDEARRGDYTALEVGGYARRAQIAEEEADAAEARLKVATRNALEMAAQHLTDAADRTYPESASVVLRWQADQIRALADTDLADQEGSHEGQ